jgi:hypothetical protein
MLHIKLVDIVKRSRHERKVNLQASALNNDLSFFHTFYVILVGALYVQVGIFLCNGCRNVYRSKCLKQKY